MQSTIAQFFRDLRYVLARTKFAALLFWRRHRPEQLSWESVAFGADLQRIHEHTLRVFDESPLNGISQARADQLFGRDKYWWFSTDQIDHLEGEILIEPGYSIATLPGRRLFEPTRNVRKEFEPVAARPPHGAQVIDADALVHFDGFLSSNLWHFHCDCLGPLLMLRASGKVDPTLPVLIHRQVHDLPHVRHALAQPDLADVNWLVQEPGQWVRARRLYKADGGRDGFLRTRALFQGGSPKAGGSRRIFLGRRARFRRSLSNVEDVLPLLEARGFERVFAEDLPYEEQVALFRETGIIVGMHGAGLTNMLFADTPHLSLLEILTESYGMSHYYWLSRTLSVRYYDALFGSPLDWTGNYAVDPSMFEAALDRMLADRA